MDKLELLVSRHKKIIRKEKYKKADKKLDIIFVQACYYVVNEYLGLKDQFRNVSENISFPDFCSSYLETVEKKDRRFAEIIRSYLFHESVYAMEIKSACIKPLSEFMSPPNFYFWKSSGIMRQRNMEGYWLNWTGKQDISMSSWNRDIM